MSKSLITVHLTEHTALGEVFHWTTIHFCNWPYSLCLQIDILFPYSKLNFSVNIDSISTWSFVFLKNAAIYFCAAISESDVCTHFSLHPQMEGCVLGDGEEGVYSVMSV